MTENDIGGVIVDRAIRVHSILGPGLLESTYETPGPLGQALTAEDAEDAEDNDD